MNELELRNRKLVSLVLEVVEGEPYSGKPFPPVKHPALEELLKEVYRLEYETLLQRGKEYWNNPQCEQGNPGITRSSSTGEFVPFEEWFPSQRVADFS